MAIEPEQQRSTNFVGISSTALLEYTFINITIVKSYTYFSIPPGEMCYKMLNNIWSHVNENAE